MTPDSFHQEPTEPEDALPEEGNAPDDGGNTESLGSYLRQERLRQNKNLKEVAEATCIHLNTLEALEEENRSQLPAEVFVRGFISIYAQHLGLDAQEALNKYGRQAATKWTSPGTAHKRRKITPRKPAPTGVPRRAATILILACLAGLLGYWGYQQKDLPTLGEDGISGLLSKKSDADPKEKPGPEAVPEGHITTAFRPAPDLENQEGSPKSIVSSERQALRQDEEVQEASPEPIAPIPPDAQPAPAESASAEKTTTEEPRLASAPVQEKPESAEAVPSAPGNPAVERSGFNYVLRAKFTETTWLRVYVDGRKPTEYTFHAGEQYTWKANDNIKLFLGNAGGVDLILNDHPLPKPGASGHTARLSIPGQST